MQPGAARSHLVDDHVANEHPKRHKELLLSRRLKTPAKTSGLENCCAPAPRSAVIADCRPAAHLAFVSVPLVPLKDGFYLKSRSGSSGLHEWVTLVHTHAQQVVLLLNIGIFLKKNLKG